MTNVTTNLQLKTYSSLFKVLEYFIFFEIIIKKRIKFISSLFSICLYLIRSLKLLISFFNFLFLNINLNFRVVFEYDLVHIHDYVYTQIFFNISIKFL